MPLSVYYLSKEYRSLAKPLYNSGVCLSSDDDYFSAGEYSADSSSVHFEDTFPENPCSNKLPPLKANSLSSTKPPRTREAERIREESPRMEFRYVSRTFDREEEITTEESSAANPCYPPEVYDWEEESPRLNFRSALREFHHKEERIKEEECWQQEESERKRGNGENKRLERNRREDMEQQRRRERDRGLRERKGKERQAVERQAREREAMERREEAGRKWEKLEKEREKKMDGYYRRGTERNKKRTDIHYYERSSQKEREGERVQKRDINQVKAKEPKCKHKHYKRVHVYDIIRMVNMFGAFGS